MQLATFKPKSAAASQIEFGKYELAAAYWESLSAVTLPVGLYFTPFFSPALLDAAEQRVCCTFPRRAKSAWHIREI